MLILDGMPAGLEQSSWVLMLLGCLVFGTCLANYEYVYCFRYFSVNIPPVCNQSAHIGVKRGALCYDLGK